MKKIKDKKHRPSGATITRRGQASIECRPLALVLREIAALHTASDKVCGFAITFRYDHSARKMYWGELNINKVRNSTPVLQLSPRASNKRGVVRKKKK